MQNNNLDKIRVKILYENEENYLIYDKNIWFW